MHGLLGSKNNFRTIFKSPLIAPHLKTCYLVDLRNHGDSFHHENSSLSEFAADLNNFIIKNSIENPIIMGHSLGGKILMKFLSLYPNQCLKSSIIVDISPLGQINEEN